MGKGSSSDDFVRDYKMAHRVSGCCVAHLGFTACAATYTEHHVKEGVRSPSSRSRLLLAYPSDPTAEHGDSANRDWQLSWACPSVDNSAHTARVIGPTIVQYDPVSTAKTRSDDPLRQVW